MNHTLIDILFISIIIVLYILAYFKQVRKSKSYTGLIQILSKNIDLLLEYHKKKEIVDLKNSIQLYTKFQIISKISKCDYVTFFKYDYSNRLVILNYVLAMDNNGSMIQEFDMDKLPITGYLLTLNILNIQDKKLYSLYTKDFKNNNTHLHTVMLKKDINKIYYKNVYKEDNKPFGIILISYKDENYEIENEDKDEIIRVIDNIKYYI